MADMSAFTGLPIEELIGGPLIGAAKGQAKLAQITMDFVNQMAFQEDGVTAKLIPVIVDRLVKNPDTGAVEKLQQTLQVSPITLVEIPNFSMQDMEIEFSMESDHIISLTHAGKNEMKWNSLMNFSGEGGSPAAGGYPPRGKHLCVMQLRLQDIAKTARKGNLAKRFFASCAPACATSLKPPSEIENAPSVCSTPGNL